MKPNKSLALVALIASLLLAACGSGTAASSSTTTLVATTTTKAKPVVTGMLTLIDSGIHEYDSEGTTYCMGWDGYDDIQAGANVVVYDGEGSIIGTGALDAGQPDGGVTCDFGFSLTLSRTADFYTVDVAGRGGVTYSHDDMEQSGWAVGLSLS